MNARTLLWAAAPLLVLVFVPACGSAPTCVTGATAACTCTDGRMGAQTCTGSGFGACECSGSTQKRIFITASLYEGGQLGGLDGADAKCNTSAAAVNLGGTWKAWLSSSTVDAIDRIADVGPWFNVGTGEKVFNNKANLTTVPLAKADVDERGERLSYDVTLRVEDRVWTGTPLGGDSSFAKLQLCQEWTVGNPYDGQHGSAKSLGNAWTFSGNAGCTQPLRLYCLEQ